MSKRSPQLLLEDILESCQRILASLLAKLLFIVFPGRHQESIVPVLVRPVMFKVGLDGGFQVAVPEIG
jgi:hypothetical protein